MATTSLFFDIFARDKGVESTLDRIGNKAKDTDTKFGKFGNTMNSLAGPAAIGLGAVGALALKFGNTAAEAEQNMGAVETVFGKAADKVVDYSERAANAVGLSESAYNQLSATTGTALKAAGVSFDDLAEKNDMLITRGADLASLFGGTTSEAVKAMGSAFRGEFDPLERYGLTLNMNTVNAALAEKGLDKLTGAALDQAKKQEILNLIMEQSTQAQGNFAREADTTAGAQQRATANFEDASAALGEKLLPMMTKLAEVATTVATWIAENSDLVMNLTLVLGTLAAGVVVASGAMTVLNIVMAANPIGLVIIAVAALIAVIVLLAANWDKVTRFISEKWTGLTNWWSDGMRKIGGQWNKFWTDTGNNARNTWNNTIGPIFDTIQRVVTKNVPDAFKSGVRWIGEHWGKLEGIVKAPVRFLINNVINDGLIGAFNTVAGWINIGKLSPVRIPGFKTGGYTGNMAADEPAGVVHGGEFVFTKEETDKAGVGTLQALAKSLRGYMTGGFVNPLAKMRLTQGYSRAHKGIDLAASVGTPVFAAQGGTVRHAGPGARAPGVWGGTEIHIAGPGNIETWYAHLSRLGVSVGQKVGPGYPIGLSGNTGISSGPHLHFGMFRGGWPNDMNPLMFLGGAGIPGAAGGTDNAMLNPITGIVGGLMSAFRSAFSGGNIVADLAIGVGRKLLGGAGEFVAKQMGFGGAAGVFDSGGWLETVGVNKSGKPEPVLTGQQWDDIHRLAARGASFNLDGYTLELNADATKATFRRLARNEAEDVMQDASDDVYRGRAR